MTTCVLRARNAPGTACFMEPMEIHFMPLPPKRVPLPAALLHQSQGNCAGNITRERDATEVRISPTGAIACHTNAGSVEPRIPMSSMQHTRVSAKLAGRSERFAAAESTSTLVDLVGNTPLLRLRIPFRGNPRVGIYAKAEWCNPGGSVKDRAALSMIRSALRSGELTGRKTLIDATSGNTGIAYAMFGSSLGFHVSVVLPANASMERKQILRAYGAKIIETDPLAGTDGAQDRAREIVASDPGKYFYPDQYNNDDNWRAHYESTAIEIWEQTGERVTHFVAGLGTSGTFVGTSRRLKLLEPGIKCYDVQPDSPLHGLEGLKHLPTAAVPGIYDDTLADEHLVVSTEDAYHEVHRLAREEGLFVGLSSGAAMAACVKLAARIDAGTIVTVFPDGGSRYSEFWERLAEERDSW
jgi:S-sulfo-L-cysteine synthase (O-acetyl-L-serine-dependent)